MSSNDTGVYYGGGVQIDIAEPWSLRLAWRADDLDARASLLGRTNQHFDLSTFSAAVEYQF